MIPRCIAFYCTNYPCNQVGRIAFAYADGIAHRDKMIGLGLKAGAENLPAMSMNAPDGTHVPYPSEASYDSTSILHFCSAFITGKRDQTISRGDPTMIPIRSEYKSTPQRELRPGILDDFSGSHDVVALSRSSLTELLQSNKDIVVLFHSEHCESCAYLIPHYKVLYAQCI